MFTLVMRIKLEQSFISFTTVKVIFVVNAS